MYEIYASNKVFSEIFYVSPSPMWVLDAESLAFLAVNDSAVQLYGYSRDEFLRMKVLDVRVLEDREQFAARIRAQNEHVVRSGVIRHVGKSGTAIYVDITRQRIHFEGRPAWLVMLRDLTERTIALRAAAESEKKYKTLVEQSLVGMYTLKGSMISYANARFAAIFGYSQEEITGKDIFEFVYNEADREEMSEMLRLRQLGDMTEKRYVRSGRRKDGSEAIVEIWAAQVDTEDGPVTFGFVLDLTDAKLAESKIATYVNELALALEHTIEALSTMGELRDAYTAGHQQRTGTIAEAIGKEMGLTSDSLTGLRICGLLHDIGKVAVPIEILTKPTRLTPGEYTIIKTHSQWSYDITKNVHFRWPVATALLQHHERLDGSGYPNGLRDNDITLEARIIAVADVLESMASHRPYRPALGIDIALNEISANAGTQFDRDVERACARLMRDGNYQLPSHQRH